MSQIQICTQNIVPELFSSSKKCTMSYSHFDRFPCPRDSDDIKVFITEIAYLKYVTICRETILSTFCFLLTRYHPRLEHYMHALYIYRMNESHLTHYGNLSSSFKLSSVSFIKCNAIKLSSKCVVLVRVWTNWYRHIHMEF